MDSDKGTGPFWLEYRGARKDEGRLFMGSKTGKKGYLLLSKWVVRITLGFKSLWRNFFGGPVVKSLLSNAGGVCSMPGQGAKI